MAYKQVRKPNPNIKCKPGWCLVYVQETFSIGAKSPTAKAAWNVAKYRHADQNFPSGVAMPIFFNVKGNADGHVALRMADGSIYSASSPTSTTPVHHASLAAMQQYWGKGTMLEYLGWTCDLEGELVIQEVVTHATAPAKVAARKPVKGTATVTVPTLNVRSAPTTSSAIVATYKKNQSFKYDSYQIAAGYVWLSYVGGSGKRRYVAQGPNDGNPNTVYVRGGV